MTANVRIISDSGLYLDNTLLKSYRIAIVPMLLQLQGKVYREGQDITDEEFLQQMEASGELPSIKSPPARVWTETYEAAGKEAAYVIVLTQSARLSNAYQQARIATQNVMGRVRIWVVDTQTVGFGQGIIVREAARLAAEGMPAPEVVRRVRAMIPHVYVQFLIDRLDYLERYGRVGPAQALLGTMLRIKPLVTIEGGDLIAVEKVQDWEKGIQKLHDFVAEFLRIEEMAIVQRGMVEQTAMLLERLEMTFEGHSFPIIGYGPSLAVHLGPTALGVVVYEGVTE